VHTAFDLDAVMMPANLARFKHRQRAGFDHACIFRNGPFLVSVVGDAVVVELLQGTAADASHNDPIHLTPAQGSHGVACAVLMILVGIVEDFNRVRLHVHKHKIRRRSKMAVHITVDPFVFYYRKSNFHFYLVSLIKS